MRSSNPTLGAHVIYSSYPYVVGCHDANSDTIALVLAIVADGSGLPASTRIKKMDQRPAKQQTCSAAECWRIYWLSPHPWLGPKLHLWVSPRKLRITGGIRNGYSAHTSKALSYGSGIFSPATSQDASSTKICRRRGAYKGFPRSNGRWRYTYINAQIPTECSIVRPSIFKPIP